MIEISLFRFEKLIRWLFIQTQKHKYLHFFINVFVLFSLREKL